jgi:two-component system, NtrC family, sensor kinase
MQSLPHALKVYLAIVYAHAVGLFLLCAHLSSSTRTPFYVFAGFFLLVTLTELSAIAYKQGVVQTVTTAVMLAAVLIFDPVFVLLLAASGTFFGDLVSRRMWIRENFSKYWYKACFNISYRIIVFGVVSILVYLLDLQSISRLDAFQIFKLFVISGTYVVLSSVLMWVVVALSHGHSLKKTWRSSVTFINLYDVTLVPYGLVLAWLWTANIWYFLVGLLPLVAMHRSFKVHAGLLREQEATAQLAAQQQKLQEATTLLLSSNDTHNQLDTLLQHMMEVFPVARADVLLWDEHHRPGLIVSRGDEALALPIDRWGLKLTRRFITASTGGRPVVFVPLVTPDDMVGCLILVVEPSLQPRPESKSLLETFAAQAALAIYQGRLIEQLKSSQVRVVQSERLAAIGTLAAGVAHEFNNLLAGIGGMAQLALLEPDEHEQRAALETVAQAAQHGAGITRGLLTFARQLEPKREAADLHAAVEPVLAMLQAEFRRKHIDVVRQFEPLPQLLCDIGMLAQVTLNLLTNAIDAMNEDGGTLIVTLRQHDDWIILAVSDTGSGVPEHVRSKMFEPFVSTKNGSDGKLHGGTGLGLAISYGIVAEHGGEIDVESEPGRGTTMTVRLPLHTAANAPPTAHVPLSVIVVDDEPVSAKSLHGLLTREGHYARWFTEPDKALEALEGGDTVDLIFADLIMPEMDGVTLLEQARRRAPTAHPVVMASQHNLELLARAQALGFTTILEKPFSADTLRLVVAGARTLDLRPPQIDIATT